MALRFWKNPETEVEITLDETLNGYVMWYKDDKNPRYWETFFTPHTRYPSYNRVAKRPNSNLREYAEDEFSTMVAVQKDGIEIRALVRRYEERCWAERSSLEDLPLVMTWMTDPDALDIVEQRLHKET